MSSWTPPGPVGAHLNGNACDFRVWAPAAEKVTVHLGDRKVTLVPQERGYHFASVDGVKAGDRYKLGIDNADPLPDPATRHQPDGVHGDSAVVAEDFAWTDTNWRAPKLRDLVIYELHVGTFTREGTFDAIIPELQRLRDVGINAIELLPVAQFPGSRNWGYDGVYPFAAQNTYGGPESLKRLVNAAHAVGMSVILDVVYNHLGPEGNYLPAYGPYFTDRYRTPWGDALNYDGPHSDDVRAFFIQSALQWIDEFHIDGLRFDAIHAIVDASAYPFLAELTDTLRDRMKAIGRTAVLIAESDLSDPRVIRPSCDGGLGFDTQWLDDFHHAVHTVVTGESQGYYVDYGSLQHLATCLERAYVYAGDFQESRNRRHGAPLKAVNPEQFIVCAQNHDQIGNRLAGDRLSTLITFEQQKLVAACTLLSPFVPMLYMGEEYGETAPFPYFVSHGDEELVAAVRKGRKEEFASFGWSQEPPDPQAESTFNSALLHPDRARHGEHRALLNLHRDLIALRRATPLLHSYDSLHAHVREERILDVQRKQGNAASRLLLNFSEHPTDIALDGSWSLAIATDDPIYGADLADLPESGARQTVRGAITISPHTAVLLLREYH